MTGLLSDLRFGFRSLVANPTFVMLAVLCLGIGIVPRAVVSSLTAAAGLVVIPLSAARAAGVLTLVYRDNDGQPNAVQDFVEALRSTGEGRASPTAPIAMRASR